MASPGDENWSDEFGLSWLNAPVLALADDGVGGVYLGGEFTGDFSYIAHWDGQQPRSLGSGLNGWVRALAANSAGNLYAGGSIHHRRWRERAIHCPLGRIGLAPPRRWARRRRLRFGHGRRR